MNIPNGYGQHCASQVLYSDLHSAVSICQRSWSYLVLQKVLCSVPCHRTGWMATAWRLRELMPFAPSLEFRVATAEAAALVWWKSTPTLGRLCRRRIIGRDRGSDTELGRGRAPNSKVSEDAAMPALLALRLIR